MSIMAQISDTVKAASDLANSAAQFGFLAQLVMVLILIGAGGLTLYVWKVVVPERNARIAQMEKHADAAVQNSTALALIGKSLESISQVVQTLPCRLRTP